jgi:hypothetical protein
MSRFAAWTPGLWVTFSLGVALIFGGLLMVVPGPALARRQARKAGRVDADGDPWYEDNNSPQATVRGGLIGIGIGALYTLWNLHNGGVL